MAQFYKIIVSGSAAKLLSLQLDTALTPLYGGLGLSASSASAIPVGNGTNGYALIGSNGAGRVVRESGAQAVNMSGSFSGSFVGDGSGLTGISSAPTFTISGSTGGTSFVASTDTLTFTTASVHGFDMSMSFATTRKTVWLITPQDLRTNANVTHSKLLISNDISASLLQLTGIGGGTSDNVLILSGQSVVSRSIDTRVWGTSLVDGSGSATRVGFWSDANTIVSDANFTYDGTRATINGSTFGQDVVIAGDLTVLGNVVQLQVTNLNVEDRFILLNSGSLTGDGGLVVSSGSTGNGVALGFDDSQARWGIQQSTLLTLSSSALTPEMWLSTVTDVDGGQSLQNYSTRNGNIMVSGSEIYIYA